jgi:hypothetical protein
MQTIRIQFERVRVQLIAYYKRAESAATAEAITTRLDKADAKLAAGFVVDQRTGLRVRRS